MRGAENARVNSKAPAAWELGALWRQSNAGGEDRAVWEHGKEADKHAWQVRNHLWEVLRGKGESMASTEIWQYRRSCMTPRGQGGSMAQSLALLVYQCDG